LTLVELLRASWSHRERASNDASLVAILAANVDVANVIDWCSNPLD
jgi:hypothetical protein